MDRSTLDTRLHQAAEHYASWSLPLRQGYLGLMQVFSRSHL